MLITWYAAAQKTIALSEESGGRTLITKDLEVLIDSTEKLDLPQILTDSTLHFLPQENIGRPGKNVYWVRVNLASNFKDDIVLRAGAVWWDYATFYLLYPDSTTRTIESGLLRKTSERGGNRFATFTLPAGKQLRLFARLSSSGYFMRMENVNVSTSRHETFMEGERYAMYLAAILVGILVGFAFYNLSFSVLTGDKSYVWYFLYLIALAISYSGQLGASPSYLTQFFLPEHPIVGLFLKRFSDPIAFTSLIIFSMQFMGPRQISPLWNKIFYAIILAMVVEYSYWLSGHSRSNGLGLGLYQVAVGAVIIAAVMAYKNGFKVVRFFLVGQILVFLGLLYSFFALVLSIDLLWFLPSTPFLNFVKSSASFFFGAIEALVFSMALADRQKERLEALVTERTDELNNSLTTLKTTQSQLIQSEKLASLGELTAGIAHEIQNPLNFVNNFSEVNSELITELEQEVSKGNVAAVKAIAKDIRENEQKIVHHGKRADAIVKGMLQHSRTSSGVKEHTDINALCDEYLRLAFHGLRAKDKSFNAKFETNLDPTIGTLNVVPQEIGRVILNLINNAFYAATERKKLNAAHFEPTVTVSTKKAGDRVEIRVEDNGVGIPQRVLDKIFQPFFTTKPAGQGTGLGLSLSYDIVTKGHGGELRVETKEGEGSVFVIVLHIP